MCETQETSALCKNLQIIHSSHSSLFLDKIYQMMIVLSMFLKIQRTLSFIFKVHWDICPFIGHNRKKSGYNH